MIAAMAALTMLGGAGVAAAQTRQERSGAPIQRMDHGPEGQGRFGRGEMGQGPRGGRGPMGGPGRMGPPSPDRMFGMMDANRDGSVSRAEFDAFHARMRGMREGRGGPGMDHGGRMGPGAERQGGRQLDPGVRPYPKPTR
jgi:hypothetical protein